MKINPLIILPLSLSLMLYPSLNLYVGLDGANTYYSGFPIPWNSNSLVTSLAKDIYLIPLVIDLLFYLAIGFVLWRYLSHKLLRLTERLNALIVSSVWIYRSLALIITVIWIYGSLALIFMVAVSMMEPSSSLSYWPDTHIFQILKVSVGGSI